MLVLKTKQNLKISTPRNFLGKCRIMWQMWIALMIWKDLIKTVFGVADTLNCPSAALLSQGCPREAAAEPSGSPFPPRMGFVTPATVPLTPL